MMHDDQRYGNGTPAIEGIQTGLGLNYFGHFEEIRKTAGALSFGGLPILAKMGSDPIVESG